MDREKRKRKLRVEELKSWGGKLVVRWWPIFTCPPHDLVVVVVVVSQIYLKKQVEIEIAKAL